MELLIVVIVLFSVSFVSYLVLSSNKKSSSQTQLFTSNSQISISSGSSCSLSNNNGNITINGKVKSLIVNGKKIEV